MNIAELEVKGGRRRSMRHVYASSKQNKIAISRQGELQMRTRRWIAVNYAVQAGGVTAEDRSTNNAEQSSQERATQDSQ